VWCKYLEQMHGFEVLCVRLSVCVRVLCVCVCARARVCVCVCMCVCVWSVCVLCVFVHVKESRRVS